jgi:predicted amidohydrolase
MTMNEPISTSSQQSITIGMGQLLVEGGEPHRNIQRATKLVEKASEDHCDLIILPETLDFAWTHPSVYEEALPIPGEFSDQFCELAAKYGLYICLGLTERAADHKLYNAALLIDHRGTILLKYHKINLLQVELPFYEVGQSLNVIDTPLGRIGINICADNYIDSIHIGKTLGSMGAQLILSPSSWTVDHSIKENEDPYKEKWIKPLSRIAYLFDTVVVSTTSVGYIVGGPYEGMKMVGRSLAVGREGIIAQGQFNEFAGELVSFTTTLPANPQKGTQLTEKATDLEDSVRDRAAERSYR